MKVGNGEVAPARRLLLPLLETKPFLESSNTSFKS
jgi:hypothetical protein